MRKWLERVGVRALFIEPGFPWENGYAESFNGNLADEMLEREVFYTLHEAKVLIERSQILYNTLRHAVRWGIVHRHRGDLHC